MRHNNNFNLRDIEKAIKVSHGVLVINLNLGAFFNISKIDEVINP
jgi:hypothetical protein